MAGDELQEAGVLATKGSMPKNLAPKDYASAMRRAAANGLYLSYLKDSFVPKLLGKVDGGYSATAPSALKKSITAVKVLLEEAGLFADAAGASPVFPCIAARASTLTLTFSADATEDLMDRPLFGRGAFATFGRIAPLGVLRFASRDVAARRSS